MAVVSLEPILSIALHEEVYNALESSWFQIHLTPGSSWFTLDVNSAEGVCCLCAKAWPRMMWFFLSCTQEIVHGLRHRYVMRLLYQEYCVRFADCLSCGLSGVFCWVGNIANKSGLRMHNFGSGLGMVVGGRWWGMYGQVEISWEWLAWHISVAKVCKASTFLGFEKQTPSFRRDWIFSGKPRLKCFHSGRAEIWRSPIHCVLLQPVIQWLHVAARLMLPEFKRPKKLAKWSWPSWPTAWKRIKRCHVAMYSKWSASRLAHSLHLCICQACSVLWIVTWPDSYSLDCKMLASFGYACRTVLMKSAR